MNEMVKAGQLQKIEPDFIEGEFSTDAESWIGKPSGYFCLRCEAPLLVGEKSCPRCPGEFGRPTLPREAVERMKPEFRLHSTLGRMTAEEMERSRQYRKKRH